MLNRDIENLSMIKPFVGEEDMKPIYTTDGTFSMLLSTSFHTLPPVYLNICDNIK